MTKTQCQKCVSTRRLAPKLARRIGVKHPLVPYVSITYRQIGFIFSTSLSQPFLLCALFEPLRPLRETPGGSFCKTTQSANMSPTRIHINRIQTLATSHKQSVSLCPAKRHIRTGFRQPDNP